LLVAPVLLEGHRSKSVYLPADDWIYIWNGSEFSVGTKSDKKGIFVEVEAEIGNPPVFYRKASQWSQNFEELRKRKTKFKTFFQFDISSGFLR